MRLHECMVNVCVCVCVFVYMPVCVCVRTRKKQHQMGKIICPNVYVTTYVIVKPSYRLKLWQRAATVSYFSGSLFHADGARILNICGIACDVVECCIRLKTFSLVRHV